MANMKGRKLRKRKDSVGDTTFNAHAALNILQAGRAYK